MKINLVRGKGPCSNLFFESCKSLYLFMRLFEAEEMAPGVRPVGSDWTGVQQLRYWSSG